jgi:RNA polymerase sigma-70 factor (ECF subfamily)
VDRQIDLQRALARLKPSFREVLTLRFLHDVSIEETATALTWTTSKVQATQHRALKKLRELL